MKSFIILVCFVAYAVASHEPGLRVKFSIGLRPGTDFFFDVPVSVAQAILSRWSLTPRPEGTPLPLSMYCHSNYNVCVLFDDSGSAAGVQIALDQNEYSDNVYDMKVTGFSEWVVTTRSGEVRRFWAIAMYFVSKDYLQLPVSERDANRNSSKFLQEDAVWITGFNGVVDKFPVEDSEIQKSIFTRQACTPWMGRHYFYNMKKDTECRADTIYPWFLLTDSDKLMGVGLNIAGKNKIKDGERDFFEHPPRLAIWAIVPQGPECLYDLADSPGVLTMHVYFINRPWTIGCPIFVKFSIGLRPGTDFFFDVPRSVAQAILSGWKLTPRPVGPLPSLYLYCHTDLTVCVFFDDTGNAAGLQIALDQNKFTDNPFDMKVTGFSEWEVISSGQVRKFWTTATYFVSEDYLRLPASEREANRDSSKFLQEDAVWVTGFNGVVDKVSAEDSEIQKSMFTRQACIPWMGRHYYYDTRKDSECRADTMHPWFLLTDSGKLMAVGLTVIGKYPTIAGKRDWFEHSSRLAVKVILPRGPQCLYDLADTPGRITMHVYFINRPWTIGCPLFNK